MTQSAFYVNLYRAVIGPSATLTGRWRPDVDLRRMLAGDCTWHEHPIQVKSKAWNRIIIICSSNSYLTDNLFRLHVYTFLSFDLYLNTQTSWGIIASNTKQMNWKFRSRPHAQLSMQKDLYLSIFYILKLDWTPKLKLVSQKRHLQTV